MLCIGLLLKFPGWHEEGGETGSQRDVKPFPSRLLVHAIVMILSVAVLLSLVPILWQHVAAVAAVTTIQHMSYGTVRGEFGTLALVLGWFAVGLLALGLVALVAMERSIFILDRLTGG